MLIQCDASQLEWRTILELSQDPIGIAEVINKEDTHALNQVAFSLPSRLIAKIYLFRTIFRGSGWAFANDVEFQHVSSDPKFWDDLNDRFFSKYSGINSCHNVWKDFVLQGKSITGPFGRSWSIALSRDRYGEIKIPWTTLSNYPVQGTGADVMMFARISANTRIKKAGIPCKIISTHDSIVWDCEKKYIEEIAAICHQVFADLPENFRRMFGYHWTVPLACEVKFGPNMKDIEKLLT